MFAQVDPRSHRLLLSVGNHDRPAARRSDQQRDEGSPEPFCVADLNLGAIDLGFRTVHWHDMVAGGACFVYR